MISREEKEDVDFEPEDELGAAGAAKAKLQKLKEELEAVKKERQEYLDGWQRCKADTVNARKEALGAMDRAAQRAKEEIVMELLPALDSFDMAAGSEMWMTLDENWRAGMDMVRNQLLDALSAQGVTRFGKIGEGYSPHLHEAVQEVDDMPGESGSVARVLRHGYRMGERVLRPAQVIIKK